MDTFTYQPSEKWKKYLIELKLYDPPKEPNGEYYWERMVREAKENEREEAEFAEYLRSETIHNKSYRSDEKIMYEILNGNGDALGY